MTEEAEKKKREALEMAQEPEAQPVAQRVEKPGFWEKAWWLLSGSFFKIASVACFRQWPALNQAADSRLSQLRDAQNAMMAGGELIDLGLVATGPVDFVASAQDRVSGAIRGTSAELSEARSAERSRLGEYGDDLPFFDGLGWETAGLVSVPIDTVRGWVVGDKKANVSKTLGTVSTSVPNSDTTQQPQPTRSPELVRR